jgi:hypothetical protein
MPGSTSAHLRIGWPVDIVHAGARRRQRDGLEVIVDPASFLLGAVLMVLVPLGILVYVALVIAIPVYRAIGWFHHRRTGHRKAAPPIELVRSQ